jgi:hypothetical protein
VALINIGSIRRLPLSKDVAYSRLYQHGNKLNEIKGEKNIYSE